jgi:hypothetical protein
MVIAKNAKILAILVGFWLCSTAFAENPIFQTYYSPDPAPVVFGDTVCVYTGNDEGGDFFTMHGWRVSCSTDMVNWTDRGTLILSHADFHGTANENGDWAAQVVRRNNKYYYYVTVGVGGCRAIKVAVADKPEGPFKDALNGKHLAGPSCEYIDPTVWIDDDGQAYLYWGNPNLYWAKLNEDMISFNGDIHKTDMSTGFAPPGEPSKYTEGPWIHKRGKKYYMIYASHGIPEKISYSTSDNPTGPWTWAGVIMDQGNNTAFTNHSGIIDFKGRSFFFYHNQKNVHGGGYSRSTAVEEFTWTADGYIPTIKSTNNGVVEPIHYLNPFKRVEAETKSWVGGIEVNTAGGHTVINHVGSESGTVFLTNMNSKFYTKVRSVDMGDGADRIVISTRGNGGKIELHADAEDGPVLATMDVPASSSWQESTFDLSGAVGVTDLFFMVKQAGFDFDYWYMESDKQAVPQTPYNGVAASFPGKVEAENYDEGGHNKSFFDKDAENQGKAYREDEVDIVTVAANDASKGYAIGYTQSGEWLEYTVNVSATAKYDIVANVATAMDDVSALQLFIDDKAITESIVIPKVDTTWNVYKEVSLGSADIEKGTHVLKLMITGGYLNVDWIQFTDPNAPAEEDKKDSVTQEKKGEDSKKTPEEKAGLISIDGFGLSQGAAYYDVFSLSGKRLDRIDGGAFSSGELSVLLKQAGFANGIYFVRSRVKGGPMMQKVIVNGK